MNYESLLIIVTCLYLLQIGVILFGLNRETRAESTETPFVSVIIAARNEEITLGSCLASVCAQTYPAELFEIIVVDDQSEDGTRKVAESQAKVWAGLQVISSSPDGPLRGKTNALATGIRSSKGEIIMITDADCHVPPTWVSETVRQYSPKVGIVGGLTLQSSENAFGGMQSLDWAYLLGIASSAVALKNPLSTIGNNLSFRRKAYDQVGGYETIPFSITEDYSLFQAIVKTGTWEYLYPIAPGLLVESKPCRSWKDLLRQKHRWGKGGLDMKLSGFLIMLIGFLQHAFILTGPFYGAVAPAALALLVKACGDYAILYTVLRKVNRLSDLRFFYAFQLYYLLYVLALPFLVFFKPRVRWKGRSY